MCLESVRSEPINKFDEQGKTICYKGAKKPSAVYDSLGYYRTPYNYTKIEPNQMLESNRTSKELDTYELATDAVEIGIHVFDDLPAAQLWLTERENPESYTIFRCECDREDFVAAGKFWISNRYPMSSSV